jgi:glycosyltransferase involved in cell wall biosynthesis
LRNDREYCHAPDPQSNACQLCLYGSIRPLHYQAFNDLFQRFPIRAVAPSEFALELWREKFPVVTSEGQVVPNARLEWGERSQSIKEDRPLRIAFVGYPVLHKGWQTWLNLTDKFGKDPRYKFYHFSSDWQPSTNFERVSVEVNRQNRTAMTVALRENRIDVAFLWSICPETFSFTLYESLAAGCYVITNPTSGNIQDTIFRNPQWGTVYSNETELFGAFDSGEILLDFVSFNENDKRIGSLITTKNSFAG